MQPVHRAFIFSVASEDKGAKPLYPLLSVGNVESVYKNGIFAPLALKRLACVAGVKREGGGDLAREVERKGKMQKIPSSLLPRVWSRTLIPFQLPLRFRTTATQAIKR